MDRKPRNQEIKKKKHTKQNLVKSQNSMNSDQNKTRLTEGYDNNNDGRDKMDKGLRVKR